MLQPAWRRIQIHSHTDRQIKTVAMGLQMMCPWSVFKEP